MEMTSHDKSIDHKSSLERHHHSGNAIGIEPVISTKFTSTVRSYRSSDASSHRPRLLAIARTQ